MRKYWVLATGWHDHTWPNDELWQIVAQKSGDMMLEGRLVLGTLGPRHAPLGLMQDDGVTRRPWVPDWRCAWVKNLELPATWADLSFPTRTLRIFTSEAAALEYADFVLSYGAEFSFIMSEEEVEALSPLPDDQYIDAMIVDPTDTARIELLRSKTISQEHMQYYRENKMFHPDTPFIRDPI